MSELGCKTTLAEVPEVPRLERTMLSKDATVVELEAMVSQVQLRRRVRREMAGTEAAVACLGWLQRHSERRYDGCEHDLAHAALPERAAAQPAPCLIGVQSELSDAAPSSHSI